jgi:muramidase (phage lysozyme)
MWIFSNTGFVSAVSNGKELMVRARDKKSLEPLVKFAQVEIKKSPTRDYPYRVVVSNELFANWLSHLATAIDYGNFKSEVSATRGNNFAHPLMKVWSAMHDVEDSAARKREWEE